jgi:double-stranded uracil-DNA glycosylase
VAYTPDILTAGLDVVFCGINPAATAAADGHNFSHRNNRFWTVLQRSGFTDVRLQPAEEWRLLDYGCGITAVVERPTARADELSTAEIRSAATVFEAKMRTYAPRTLAFLGKRAVTVVLGRTVAWGRIPEGVAGFDAWVLPNPSGLNRSFSLEQLVAAYAQLRSATAR